MRRWVALLIGCLGATPAFADFRSDYREGIAAAERQEWARVEELMKRAMTEQPNADRNLRVRVFGTTTVPYVPHFYLGLAAFSQKDCARALGYFEQVQALVRGQREGERLAMMMRSCRAQASAQAPAAAVDAPAATAATASPPAATPAAPATAPAAPAAPSAAAHLQRARELGDRLVRVETQLQRARAALADPALESVRGDWQRRLDPVLVRAQRARAGYDAAQRSGNAAGLAAVETEIATAESSLRTLATELEGALERRRGADLADARGAVLAQVRGRLQPLAAAYLAGDFASAATWADEGALTVTPRALAEALLLRAAARYELYVLGGERDLVALERVRSDVRYARALASDLQLNERAYSPRFRALFASTR